MRVAPGLKPSQEIKEREFRRNGFDESLTGVGGLKKNLKKKVRDYLRLTVMLLAGKIPQNWSSGYTHELGLQ